MANGFVGLEGYEPAYVGNKPEELEAVEESKTAEEKTEEE